MTEAFWQRGYCVAEDLATPAQLAFVRAAMEVSQRTGRMHYAAKVVPQGALNEYAPFAGEMLLNQIRPAVEAIVGRELAPAYAFWRIYRRGAELTRHVDRNACEISVSLPIHACPADNPWPIFVRDLQGVETGIALREGTGIVYQGCEIPHWREPFAGDLQYQVFLHYVIVDGPNAEFAFDRRSHRAIDQLLG
ncbi:MAG: hypothetical protein ACKOPM_03665 [Novosphingobium sp.]